MRLRDSVLAGGLSIEKQSHATVVLVYNTWMEDRFGLSGAPGGRE